MINGISWKETWKKCNGQRSKVNFFWQTKLGKWKLYQESFQMNNASVKGTALPWSIKLAALTDPCHLEPGFVLYAQPQGEFNHCKTACFVVWIVIWNKLKSLQLHDISESLLWQKCRFSFVFLTIFKLAEDKCMCVILSNVIKPRWQGMGCRIYTSNSPIGGWCIPVMAIIWLISE